MMACRICSTEAEHKSYSVREMQFGSREEFIYFQCKHCLCLQLKDIPDTVEKYYPDHYPSFPVVPSDQKQFLKSRLRKYATRRVLDYRLAGKSYVGKLFEGAFGSRFIPYWLLHDGLNLSSESKLLDVGCGGGSTLNYLASIGFKYLSGIDPFIPNDVTYVNGIRILKAPLASVDDRFDFIMLHHSFEHMNEQLRTLKKLNSLLKPRQYVLIRIPLSSSFAWKHYGVNWAQIDAPRHLFIHSPESMSLLASKAGFNVTEIVYDSNAFQFWASEQYARDIPMQSDESYGVNPSRSIFSTAQIDSYEAKARDLNQRRLGDQACFFLRKSG